jgi:prefoldin subunit 5
VAIKKLEDEKRGLATRMQKMEADLRLAVQRERETSEQNQVLELCSNIFCESSSDEAVNKLEEEKRDLVARMQAMEAELRLTFEREKKASEKIQALERQRSCQSSSNQKSNGAGWHHQSPSDRDGLQVEHFTCSQILLTGKSLL